MIQYRICAFILYRILKNKMENRDDVHEILDRVLIQLYENGMMENSPNNNTITLNNISSAKPYKTIFSEGYTYDRYNIRWDVYVHNIQGDFQPYIFRWILFKFNILECGMYLKFLIDHYDNNLYSIYQETVKDDNNNVYLHYIHKNPTISDVRPFINGFEISDILQYHHITFQPTPKPNRCCAVAVKVDT